MRGVAVVRRMTTRGVWMRVAMDVVMGVADVATGVSDVTSCLCVCLGRAVLCHLATAPQLPSTSMPTHAAGSYLTAVRGHSHSCVRCSHQHTQRQQCGGCMRSSSPISTQITTWDYPPYLTLPPHYDPPTPLLFLSWGRGPWGPTLQHTRPSAPPAAAHDTASRPVQPSTVYDHQRVIGCFGGVGLGSRV
jgi:hypothetical protein